MDANGNPIPAFGVITRSTLGANEENKLYFMVRCSISYLSVAVYIKWVVKYIYHLFCTALADFLFFIPLPPEFIKSKVWQRIIG